MNNMILKLKDIHGDDVYINVDAIQSFKATAHFSTITLNNGNELSVQTTPDKLTTALVEAYYMLKVIE